MGQNIDGFFIPDQFDFVDFTNKQFRDAFNILINGTSNIFIQSRAGGGKSLLIKILATCKQNVVVLSTTGTTAVELSTERIAAKTIHSFLSLPPFPIFRDEDLIMMSYKNKKVLQQAEIIVIDEVSMMSSALFDFVCDKIIAHRRDREVPRMILFGDVMQLPPVIRSTEQIVKDYYDKEYNGKVMFFNSHYFKTLDFKTIFLRKSYRQEDEELSQRLLEIGYKDHTQETLDYFNQRVMSLAKFEQQFNQYIYATPTNAMVDKVNTSYTKKLQGASKTYKATMSKNFPKERRLNNEDVEIRVGAQVMCLVNNYDKLSENNYTNGTIGVVTNLDKDKVEIEKPNGQKCNVGMSTLYTFDMEVHNNKIEYIPKEWFKQIDCRIARAVTVHKLQGKTLDAAYLALYGWVPEGLTYVGLSRIKNINSLGLSRELTEKDITVNEESYEFLTM